MSHDKDHKGHHHDEKHEQQAEDAAKSDAEKLHEHSKKVEHVMDNAADTVSEKIDEHVSPETKEKIQKFAHKADTFATEVEDFGESIDQVAERLFPSHKGSDAEFVAHYHETVSRLFIFRFLWLIIEYWIILVWSVWFSIISIIHFFYMLIRGKRHRDMWQRQVRCRRHIIKWKAYICGMTDKRPDLVTK